MYNLDLWKTSGHADHYKVRWCCLRGFRTLLAWTIALLSGRDALSCNVVFPDTTLMRSRPA